MSSRFKPTEPEPTSNTIKVTPDTQYWKGLQFPITIKEYGAITNVAFQPTKPNLFAVTASSRVELYNPETNELVKTFSRFHDVAYGATFRADGKLLIAGNEDSQVRLFDVEGRVPLRIFKGHTRPVHVTKFCSNNKHIFSAADDKSVRVWDVATEQTLHKYKQHEDYIRCGCAARNAENIILTGSYDHSVCMFDTRSDKLAMKIDHGCQVESVLMFPSGSVLLSAGGNTIKVWDVLQGGKLLAEVSHHHKTITCMCFNHDCTRLLSGGLDRHVKVYDVASYNVVHNIDYPSSILSMDISNNDKTLVVGMADHILSIRHRKQAFSAQTEERAAAKKRKHKSPFMRGQTFVPNLNDLVVAHRHKQELQKYDLYVRKFQHTKALDAALHKTVSFQSPEVTVAIMQELIRRDTLGAAVAGRDDKSLSFLLKFLIKNISNVNFSSVLLEVAELVVDIYSESMDDLSIESGYLFQRLSGIIQKESLLQTEMFKLLGCMDAIVNVNLNAQTSH